ncbi:hypothetical protein IWQ62_004475 [Dispira parvispora]|uniref:RGS domain-containing protein n=1 Tax=Dispira parvispora TaxID=1520584 RepID=A0A9W8E5K7_9FUNG|nr:hypothetical protein IWQ62_004475 [Dispira parvispora]
MNDTTYDLSELSNLTPPAPHVPKLPPTVLHTKAIIYSTCTAVYTLFVIVTSVLFVIRTRKDKYRSAKLMLIETTGTVYLCIVSGLSNAFTPHWPCFLNLWGLYLGLSLWLFGFIARTMRLLFQSEFHQAKLHITALDADNSSGDEKPTWDRVLEKNELKSQSQTRRYRFGRFIERFSWDRKRHWFTERNLIRSTMGGIFIIFVYLTFIQIYSPRFTINPPNTRCDIAWEYAPMYVMVFLHIFVVCPLLTYWLSDIHDAYGLRRDLILETVIAAVSYVLFFSVLRLFGHLKAYFGNTLFLFMGLAIIHFVGVVVPLWKTYKKPVDSLTLEDLEDPDEDDQSTDAPNGAPCDRPSRRSAGNESYKLSQAIKRQSYNFMHPPLEPPPPLFESDTLVGFQRGKPESVHNSPVTSVKSRVSLAPPPIGSSGKTLEHKILTSNTLQSSMTTNRWNGFIQLLSNPRRFENFKYYAAACFCTELTLFLEDYQQLKRRVYPLYKLRTSEQSTRSKNALSLPASDNTVARNVMQTTPFPMKLSQLPAVQDRRSTLPVNSPATDNLSAHRPVPSTSTSTKPPPSPGITPALPEPSAALDIIDLPMDQQEVSPPHVTIYETVGPVYLPLQMQYDYSNNNNDNNQVQQRLAIAQSPPVPQHLCPLFYAFYRRYIDPESALALNMPGSYTREVNQNIRNNTFSITMFDEAHKEVLKMLYENVYPRFLKMRRTSRNRPKM